MPTAIIFYVLKAEKRRDLDVLGIKKERSNSRVVTPFKNAYLLRFLTLEIM